MPSATIGPMADDDLIDVVDVDDTVIRQATRAEMRRDGLRHRAVYIVVRTSDDEVVVHRRADWKDVYPGRWDLCFGGVLDAGEGWERAAARELAEEAGIAAPLREVLRGSYDDERVPVVGRVFEAVHDGPYPCPDGEVVEVRVVPRRVLVDFLDTHEHCPDSAALVLPWLTGADGQP